MGQQLSLDACPNAQEVGILGGRQPKSMANDEMQHEISVDQTKRQRQGKRGFKKSNKMRALYSQPTELKPRGPSLLDLPLEIRWQIWTEVLTFSTPIKAGLVMNPLKFDQNSLDLLRDIERQLHFEYNNSTMGGDLHVSCFWLDPDAFSEPRYGPYRLLNSHWIVIEKPESLKTLRAYYGATSLDERYFVHSSAPWVNGKGVKGAAEGRAVDLIPLEESSIADGVSQKHLAVTALEAAGLIWQSDKPYKISNVLMKFVREYGDKSNKLLGKLGGLGSLFNYLMPATVRFTKNASEYPKKDAQAFGPYLLEEDFSGDGRWRFADLAILRTCRSIQREAVPCFLQKNTFELEDIEVGVSFFANFPKVHLQHVRHISFRSEGFLRQVGKKFKDRFDTAWNVFLWYLQRPGLSIYSVTVIQSPSAFLTDFRFIQVLLGAGIAEFRWLWENFDEDRNKHRKLAARIKQFSVRGRVELTHEVDRGARSLLFTMKSR